MKNQQLVPEALRCAEWLEHIAAGRDVVDIAHLAATSAAELRRLAALVEAQQPAPSAAAAVGDEQKALKALHYYMTECSGHEPSISVFHRMVEEALAPQPFTTPQEDSAPSAAAEPDMFWDYDDPERFGHDIEDVISEYAPGDIVKIDCAKRMPTIRVRVVADGDDLAYEVIGVPEADSATHPIDPAIAADLERSDWTPEEALRWYAAGKHYDTVPNGDGSSSARILDNGAVASNALKSMSREYAEHKGDVALSAPQADSQPAPVSSDTLYLLRRLLSNQHTLTGSEFRAELEKIVGDAAQAADSGPEDAAREAIDKVLALFPFDATIQSFTIGGGPLLTADGDTEFYSAKRVWKLLREVRTTLDAARKQGANHD